MNIHKIDMYQRMRVFMHNSMTTVPFPQGNLIHLVEGGYRTFLREPDAYKNQWSFDLSLNNDPDDGLVRKPGVMGDDGNLTDEKFFFHFRPQLLSLLHQRNVNCEKHALWLLHCTQLYNLCITLQNEYARQLDRVLPGYHFYEMVRDEIVSNLHVLRLLYYDGGNGARDHQDRSFWTIHLSQSHARAPLHTGKDKRPYVSSLDVALLFSGKKMAQHTGASFNFEENMFEGGSLPALVHGVDKEKETEQESRMAMVFFGHILATLPGKN